MSSSKPGPWTVVSRHGGRVILGGVLILAVIIAVALANVWTWDHTGWLAAFALAAAVSWVVGCLAELALKWFTSGK
mgnify:CR=1 FL=1